MDKLDQIENGTPRQINAYFRANDTSHMWPICSRFNVTERAIRHLAPATNFDSSAGYFASLDAEISRIVNSAV